MSVCKKERYGLKILGLNIHRSQMSDKHSKKPVQLECAKKWSPGSRSYRESWAVATPHAWFLRLNDATGDLWDFRVLNNCTRHQHHVPRQSAIHALWLSLRLSEIWPAGQSRGQAALASHPSQRAYLFGRSSKEGWRWLQAQFFLYLWYIQDHSRSRQRLHFVEGIGQYSKLSPTSIS